MSETDGLTWHGVVSSNLVSIAHNEQENILYVEFKNDTLYAYDGADSGLFLGLLHADSPGKFFNEYVRPLPTRKLS